MNLLERLRESTSRLHQNLEGRLDLLNDQLTLHQYTELLIRFYGFYKPLEESLIHHSSNQMNFPIDVHSKLKASHILKDLIALGIPNETIQMIPLCNQGELPDMSHPASIVGCLYVLEGSTLGGQILSRHFNKRFDITPDTGLSFFYGYGPSTAKNWKLFSSLLNSDISEFASKLNFPVHELSHHACQGACETFEKLEIWLCRQGQKELPA